MHELAYTENHRPMMAYRREGGTPWHALGTAMEKGESFESWMSRAFPYTLESLPITAQTFGAGFHPTEDLAIPNRRAIAMRYNTGRYGDVLSVMSDRYKIHQPAEIAATFKRWADDGSLNIETMGTLKGGRRMWALAKHNGDVDVVGENHEQYMLLYGSCDGSTASGARFTAVRVVCQNTLSMALARDGTVLCKQYHRTDFDPASMTDALGLIPETMAQYSRDADALAGKVITREQARDFFAAVLLSKDKQQEVKGSGRVCFSMDDPALLRKVIKTYNSAPGQETEAARGTLWGAVNAVTRYYDHNSKASDAAARLDSATFGYGQRMKAKAMKIALAA